MSHGGTPVANASTSSASQEQGAPEGATLHTMVRRGRSFSGHERNCCFLNLGKGKFADVSAVSGFDFPDDGRAIAECDWDFDGDVDLWIANRNGPQVRYLQNDLATRHHFLAIRLQGKSCSRDAIGARVEVTLPDSDTEGGKPTVLIKTLRAGEGFLAQSSKWLHFGLASASNIERVVVRWPGGDAEEFRDIDVDRRYRIVQHSSTAQLWTPPKRSGRLEPSEVSQPKSTDRARVVSVARLPLPQLEYETFDGRQNWLSQAASGRPILVNLWATWCRPCLGELRELAAREAELREAGLEVVALSVDRLDTEKATSSVDAKKLLQDIGFTGKAGWATTAATQKLQLVQNHLFDLHRPMSVPTSLLIDATGHLAVLYRGPVSVDQVLADVAELPNLATAPQAVPFAGRWHTRRERLSPPRRGLEVGRPRLPRRDDRLYCAQQEAIRKLVQYSETARVGWKCPACPWSGQQRSRVLSRGAQD